MKDNFFEKPTLKYFIFTMYVCEFAFMHVYAPHVQCQTKTGGHWNPVNCSYRQL